MQDEHGRILILGGTGEAMKLAAALAARPGLPALLSFAGRTKAPLLPSIPSRIGGFGGVDGLAAYLTQMRTPLVIDATHPFAAQMSQHAAQACARLGVPRLTFTRKPWTPAPDDRWIQVPDIEAAVDALGERPAHVFLTVGRLSLGAFKRAPQHSYVARSIDQPDAGELPPQCRVLLARPPFALADERALMQAERFDFLCTKNSGGAATENKLLAARALGLRVIMVNRPQAPEGETLFDLGEVLDWINAHRPPP